ncbi:serine hydrolase [Microbacterium invictum]|uniref:Beta-lactamase class A n=1 Tax=Microbacterium invictum TaxID=515415 RepID=A0AA40SR80_9MICO|nr:MULTISPECIES: serine hydrolase [Microbacterium]MBB4140947.1 beta-lactamase class A [Microbacterium invictum]
MAVSTRRAPVRDADMQRLRGNTRSSLRRPRGPAASGRSFDATLHALHELATSGAKVSVRVTDLDRDTVVFSGDEHQLLPVGGIGLVPLLIEVAAAFESGTVDPFEIVERTRVEPVGIAGVWQHLKAPALPLCDLAVLVAATGDALAANLLLERVGLEAVRRRIESLGFAHVALLDGFRDTRGPDDAPQVALGSAGELAAVFAALVNSKLVSPAVSAQVAEWLSLNHDLSLVASVTGLDPFSHDDDRHDLLFINKTGRADGVRAEAGVLAGPRAGVAYALLVGFDDLSIAHRLRVHEAFRTFGVDLMDHVF